MTKANENNKNLELGMMARVIMKRALPSIG